MLQIHVFVAVQSGQVDCYIRIPESIQNILIVK